MTTPTDLQLADLFRGLRTVVDTAENAAQGMLDTRDTTIADLKAQLEAAQPLRPATVFGINGHRTGEHGITRTPDSRRYYKPGAFPTAYTGLGDPVEQELTASYKLPPAEVIAGKHDARLISWHRDAKAKLPKLVKGRRHRTVPWHEPAAEIRAGTFTGDQHRDHVVHIARLLDREGLLGTFQVCPNYTMGRPGSGADFQTAWVPDADTVPAGSVLPSGDLYGNPSGGTGLDGPYPDPHDDLNVLATAARQHGYDQAAVLEVNTPRRNHDPQGVKRIAYLQTFMAALDEDAYADLAFVVVDVWEGVGKWDQRFTLPAEWAWLAALLASSPQTVAA